jgi:glycerate-2-kinase
MTVGLKHNQAQSLVACWRAGVEAAAPRRAVAAALDDLGAPYPRPWIIAAGKAAAAMAETAVTWLRARGSGAAGGLVISVGTEPGAPLRCLPGDHPLPGPRSAAAAAALGDFCASLPPEAPVWAMLSGGATSLIAGPAPGLTEADLRESYRILLESGWNIHQMNQVRKRLSRWGGGKLLRALGNRRVLQLVVSDVLDDDLAAIGSGPLAPDPSRADTIVARLEADGILSRLPPRAANLLRSIAAGSHPDVMQPGDPAAKRVTSRIIISNRVAVLAAAEAGQRLGWKVLAVPSPLQGDAADGGRRLANAALALPGSEPMLLVAGGETTVRLAPDQPGKGGRCQELALAAAEVLRAAPRDILLLAAGTDGRDGPTDAAGAMVNRETWHAIRQAGLDPSAALARHESHPALAAAGALLMTGPTGTNVADLVLILRGGDPLPGTSGGPAAP